MTSNALSPGVALPTSKTSAVTASTRQPSSRNQRVARRSRCPPDPIEHVARRPRQRGPCRRATASMKRRRRRRARGFAAAARDDAGSSSRAMIRACNISALTQTRSRRERTARGSSAGKRVEHLRLNVTRVEIRASSVSDGPKHHRLGVRPGPNAMAQPAGRRRRASIASSTNITVADDMLPKSAQHLARGAERDRREVERPLDRIEDRTAAGMDGPQSIAATARRRECRLACSSTASWIAAGTWPDSTMSKPASSNVPGHQLARSRQRPRHESCRAHALRLRGHEAAAQPSPQRQNDRIFSSSVGLLQVQRAELEIDDQHPRLRVGAHDVARQLERVDRRIAAHEADIVRSTEPGSPQRAISSRSSPAPKSRCSR